MHIRSCLPELSLVTHALIQLLSSATTPLHFAHNAIEGYSLLHKNCRPEE